MVRTGRLRPCFQGRRDPRERAMQSSIVSFWTVFGVAGTRAVPTHGPVELSGKPSAKAAAARSMSAVATTLWPACPNCLHQSSPAAAGLLGS